jgi:hypothetical protein
MVSSGRRLSRRAAASVTSSHARSFRSRPPGFRLLQYRQRGRRSPSAAFVSFSPCSGVSPMSQCPSIDRRPPAALCALSFDPPPLRNACLDLCSASLDLIGFALGGLDAWRHWGLGGLHLALMVALTPLDEHIQSREHEAKTERKAETESEPERKGERIASASVATVVGGREGGRERWRGSDGDFEEGAGGQSRTKFGGESVRDAGGGGADGNGYDSCDDHGAGNDLDDDEGRGDLIGGRWGGGVRGAGEM